MHNDLTVKLLQAVTADLGDRLRSFSKKTSTAFATRELRREMNARVRRQARATVATAKRCPTADGDTGAPPRSDRQKQPVPSLVSLTPSVTAEKPSGPAKAGTQSKQSSRRPKTFNLNTYKTHALGDYAAAVIRYGTTDSYSTAPVGSRFFPFGVF
jgi:hypothetical protein